MVSYFFHLLILHRPLEGKFFFPGYSLALMYNIALQLYPLPMFVYGCLHMKAAAASIPSSERGLSALPLLPFASEG